MKTVRSEERSTGRGATRFEAILAEITGEWIKVSDHPAARYIGRDHGIETYEVNVPDDTVTAHFYRSNSGRERVTASTGEWMSFSEADRWAAEQYDPGDGTMTFTGRQLREIIAFSNAERGCAVPPEGHLEAPWHFDAENSQLDDDDVIAVEKIILYFEEEK